MGDAAPHIGHNIGIGIHEHPLIRPGDDSSPAWDGDLRRARADLPDLGRYHMEDTVLVTEGEPKVLSRSADWSNYSRRERNQRGNSERC